MNNIFSDSHWLLTTALIIGIAAGSYGVYAAKTITVELDQERVKNNQLSQQLETTENELEQANNEIQVLSEELQMAEERNEDFEEQIEDITDTVGDISRYTSVDPELLKKYSRVFFLSENYVPSDLEEIDSKYVYDEDTEEFHERAYPFLEDMIEDAEDDDINLRIISAFRSFSRQQQLKSSYIITYGVGTANQFSAEQGYSEHQLGTTVDFTTPEMGINYTDFSTTEAYQWLLDNAHKYGFVLSYPEDNHFYQFEPWHWRFVGIELAEDLHDDDAFFYDWPQREIDEYRGEIFED
ncbi:MAG: D-alanyl-D-alanine carboxypeptidase family protein [Candidatus Paceibacterota bacterium]